MNDYERIARAIQYLDAHHAEQLDLTGLAAHLDLSPSHLRRFFSKWAGITPEDFLRFCTREHAKNLLRGGESDRANSNRLRDLCIQLETASPDELKSGGEGWTILFGFAETPFGRALIAESPRGICHLSFDAAANREDAERLISREWPRAKLHWSSAQISQLANQIFAKTASTPTARNLRVLVHGTPFQIRVWRALLEIPSGTVTSYHRVAKTIGKPTASRAVGSAIGDNEIAFLIPCHRVIRGTGVFGGYRWGALRKRAMVAWESASALR